MKDDDKNKEQSHRNYWDVNNLYGWVMSQKFPVNGFKWVRNTSQFSKDFIKRYNKESDKGYCFDVDAQYPDKLHDLQNGLPILP